MAGAVLSTTFTVAVAVAELLHSSVTIKVTVLAPRSAQVKLIWLAPKLTVPHPSDDPLSMA